MCKFVNTAANFTMKLGLTRIIVIASLRLVGTSESIWPAETPRAGCPAPYPGGSWTCPRRRLHSLSELPASANALSRTQKCCLTVRWNLLYSSLCSVLWSWPWAHLTGALLCPVWFDSCSNFQKCRLHLPSHHFFLFFYFFPSRFSVE